MEDWSRHEPKFRYMLLDRLRQDCEYYLRIGGSSNCLWAKDEQQQIQTMKDIWNTFPDGDLPKPENGNVIAIPVQACYTNETGIKVNGPCCFFFIDNTFRSLNMEKTLNVIAWTELPIYEVNKV